MGSTSKRVNSSAVDRIYVRVLEVALLFKFPYFLDLYSLIPGLEFGGVRWVVEEHESKSSTDI